MHEQFSCNPSQTNVPSQSDGNSHQQNIQGQFTVNQSPKKYAPGQIQCCSQAGYTQEQFKDNPQNAQFAGNSPPQENLPRIECHHPPGCIHKQYLDNPSKGSASGQFDGNLNQQNVPKQFAYNPPPQGNVPEQSQCYPPQGYMHRPALPHQQQENMSGYQHGHIPGNPSKGIVTKQFENNLQQLNLPGQFAGNPLTREHLFGELQFYPQSGYTREQFSGNPSKGNPAEQLYGYSQQGNIHGQYAGYPFTQGNIAEQIKLYPQKSYMHEQYPGNPPRGRAAVQLDGNLQQQNFLGQFACNLPPQENKSGQFECHNHPGYIYEEFPGKVDGNLSKGNTSEHVYGNSQQHNVAKQIESIPPPQGRILGQVQFYPPRGYINRPGTGYPSHEQSAGYPPQEYIDGTFPEYPSRDREVHFQDKMCKDDKRAEQTAYLHEAPLSGQKASGIASARPHCAPQTEETPTRRVSNQPAYCQTQEMPHVEHQSPENNSPGQMAPPVKASSQMYTNSYQENIIGGITRTDTQQYPYFPHSSGNHQNSQSYYGKELGPPPIGFQLPVMGRIGTDSLQHGSRNCELDNTRERVECTCLSEPGHDSNRGQYIEERTHEGSNISKRVPSGQTNTHLKIEITGFNKITLLSTIKRFFQNEKKTGAQAVNTEYNQNDNIALVEYAEADALEAVLQKHNDTPF
ncbi:unnamed protein product [Owenia fusiformis]|uniref:Uncharacterized protein n=1 Tax=Owenia fusiformis TaxID=6347 RepID=A0A8S4NJ52_OWEFU|nr:unnamed protein product [Owenia fusiformis]